MNSERLFLFATGILFFLLGFFLPPASERLIVNIVFSASVSFGGICFVMTSFKK